MAGSAAYGLFGGVLFVMLVQWAPQPAGSLIWWGRVHRTEWKRWKEREHIRPAPTREAAG